MKAWFRAALVASIYTSSHAYAAENGINYDPAHSADYVEAQKTNNFGLMTTIIVNDLVQIQKLGFSLVKTFFSTYCPVNGQNCVDITKLAAERKIRLMLGVYEFPDHPDWTSLQVDAAVKAVQSYPNTVVAVVVGNEDMFDWQGIPQPALQQRIIADMNTIRSRTSNKVLVTTAQREPD